MDDDGSVMIVDLKEILDLEIAAAIPYIAGMVVKPRPGRRARSSFDVAAWADTDRLVKEALAGLIADSEIPELSDEEVAEIAESLKRHEVQGALQVLLAARLTDASATDADMARDAVRLALRNASDTYSFRMLAENALPRDASHITPSGPDLAIASQDPLATSLSEYLDEKICALTALVQGRIGYERLAQIRSEAYNARIVALLGAIDRQLAALAHQEPGTGEAQFLDRYRRQAHRQHGYLTPPDFNRRRRVAIGEIYVSNAVVDVPTDLTEEKLSEWMRDIPPVRSDSLTVWDLVGVIDRTVLLGDPGGGKSTAANVLTDYFAGDASRKIPFLVTLREYASSSPINHSVAEHIEQNLKTLYQSQAPSGLVERLLLTGRAVVIFDGLDELLDTSHRRAVSDRVEQFCAAYPLTPVLVTSRVVGYDQARLDDTQFTCCRLGGFTGDDVAEYVSKWFTTQEDIPVPEAAAMTQAFLEESDSADDLLANPLMLSLMCILYRGAGSLPRSRAEVYAECAKLLLHTWDQKRGLYREPESAHLVEPTIRRLAWWLFTREDNMAAATERELITETSRFLRGRGYETEDEARAAAQEFVEFCRGRMWVFSDAGTAADGEKLYAFTHRTFMEYFAARHLVATTDTPETLAQQLFPFIASRESTIIAELAIQIRGEITDHGADRIYEFLIDCKVEEPFRRAALLRFLGNCFTSASPSPSIVRRLVGAIIECMLDNRENNDITVPLRIALFDVAKTYRRVTHDETAKIIAKMSAAQEDAVRVRAMELVLYIAQRPESESFNGWIQEQLNLYDAHIRLICTVSAEFREIALSGGFLSIGEALEMPGGLGAINDFLRWRIYDRIIQRYAENNGTKRVDPKTHEQTTIGAYLIRHPSPPWTSSHRYKITVPVKAVLDTVQNSIVPLDEISGLGLAAVLAILIDASRARPPRPDLSVIPMPVEFRQVFQDWAAGSVELVDITDD